MTSHTLTVSCAPGKATEAAVERVLREILADQERPRDERDDPELDLDEILTQLGVEEVDAVGRTFSVYADSQGSSSQLSQLVVDFGMDLAAGVTPMVMVTLWKRFFLRGVRRQLGQNALGDPVTWELTIKVTDSSPAENGGAPGDLHLVLDVSDRHDTAHGSDSDDR